MSSCEICHREDCAESVDCCAESGSVDCWRARGDRLAQRNIELEVALECCRSGDWNNRVESLVERFRNALRTGFLPANESELPAVREFERELSTWRPSDRFTADPVHQDPVLLHQSPRERVTQLERVFAGAELSPEDVPGYGKARLPLNYQIRQENLALLLHLARQAVDPVEIMIYCPMCGTKHVDVGAFATKIHHTHACQGFLPPGSPYGKAGSRCGNVWRPAHVATVGVEALSGFINKEPDASKA